MKRSDGPSETLLECCGETIAAVGGNLAREDPNLVVVSSALYALANAAEGALLLLQAAAEGTQPGHVLDVDAIALDALLRARASVEEACALLNLSPIEDCPA